MKSQNLSLREKPKKKPKAPEFKPMRAIPPKIDTSEKAWQQIIDEILKGKKLKGRDTLPIIKGKKSNE